MVVEDDPGTRRGIHQLLQDEGFEVDSVADGAEALARLKGAPKPSLILLDLAMPVMSGWDFRREQLSDPALAGIPVVVMTSYEGEYGDSMAELRASGHLQKPVRPDELRGMLQRFP